MVMHDTAREANTLDPLYSYTDESGDNIRVSLVPQSVGPDESLLVKVNGERAILPRHELMLLASVLAGPSHRVVPFRGKEINLRGPHPFDRYGLQWWICRHCYLPRSMHPVRTWTPARLLRDRRSGKRVSRAERKAIIWRRIWE